MVGRIILPREEGDGGKQVVEDEDEEEEISGVLNKTRVAKRVQR